MLSRLLTLKLKLKNNLVHTYDELNASELQQELAGCVVL